MTTTLHTAVARIVRRLAPRLSLLLVCLIAVTSGCVKQDLGWEDLAALEAEVANLPVNTTSIPIPYANAPKRSFLRTQERKDPSYAVPPVTGEAHAR